MGRCGSLPTIPVLGRCLIHCDKHDAQVGHCRHQRLQGVISSESADPMRANSVRSEVLRLESRTLIRCYVAIMEASLLCMLRLLTALGVRRRLPRCIPPLQAPATRVLLCT